jgi:hypothetical protein
VGFNKRAVTGTIALIAISMYLAIYTFEAHTIAARYISTDSHNAVFWINGPSGSLFPWPRVPGMLEILSGINDVDLFIYTYLIRTWILVGLSALAWALTGLFVYKTTRQDNSSDLERTKNLERGRPR